MALPAAAGRPRGTGSQPRPGSSTELRGASAGELPLGSPESEPGSHTDETRHIVRLTPPFWLKATEVTQDEWRARIGPGRPRFAACGGTWPVESVRGGRCSRTEPPRRGVLPEQLQARTEADAPAPCGDDGPACVDAATWSPRADARATG
jgi:formylglycine-generating enzyme required for sulfatase activity